MTEFGNAQSNVSNIGTPMSNIGYIKPCLGTSRNKSMV